MSLLASVLRRYLRVYCPDKKFHYICKPRASHYGSCVNSIALGESAISKKDTDCCSDRGFKLAPSATHTGVYAIELTRGGCNQFLSPW